VHFTIIMSTSLKTCSKNSFHNPTPIEPILFCIISICTSTNWDLTDTVSQYLFDVFLVLLPVNFLMLFYRVRQTLHVLSVFRFPGDLLKSASIEFMLTSRHPHQLLLVLEDAMQSFPLLEISHCLIQNF
jgi:hypothetical protein